MTNIDHSTRSFTLFHLLQYFEPTLKLILIFLIATFSLVPQTASCQVARISMDGYFSDWSNLTPLYFNPSNGQLTGTHFFGRLWAANDERFFFLRIEFGTEINLQNDNSIVLYLDTDNNPETGKPIHGIGAELEWYFGEKIGSFFSGNNSFSIRHRDIGLVTMPTITATEFEIAIDQNARPANQKKLFDNDTIRIVFENKASKDILPVPGAEISYTFDNSPIPSIKRLSLMKKSDDHLRVLTYNVLRDNLFKVGQRQYFERILKAIQPDIIAFEEIYEYSADQTALQIQSILPLSSKERWYRSKVNPDIVAISRHPIKRAYPIGENGAFLIDLRPKFNTDLLLIGAHPASGSRNYERQLEIDAIMAFVRDAKTEGGVLDLSSNTPIIIMGDMNLVGYAEQLRTFLQGEIVNDRQFGPSFKPDWDGTDFTALLPRQTNLLMAYTWYNENNFFNPGRLDYIIYSDSVIEPGNHFILFTPEMSADTLAKYGLQSQDVIMASDHLPVVGDFILPVWTKIKSSTQTLHPDTVYLEQNFPNPFNPVTKITYWLSKQSKACLTIYNILREEIITLINSVQSSEYQSINWDGRDQFGNHVQTGIYFYRLSGVL